jgi:hypothetical protein
MTRRAKNKKMDEKMENGKKIVVNDKLVHLCVLETKISHIHTPDERDTVCQKMCEIAKNDGVAIINEANPNLCDSCNSHDIANTRQGLK